jgi:hypothetical protein
VPEIRIYSSDITDRSSITEEYITYIPRLTNEATKKYNTIFFNTEEYKSIFIIYV